MTVNKVKQEQISIKDRLIQLKGWPVNKMRSGVLAELARSVPKQVYIGSAAFAGLIFALAVISFAIGNVIVHQGYDTIAFAKPATVNRVIRQHEVDHFGNRVSSAFGINGEVANEFADWIIEASERQQITPELLASLVLTESSFRKVARSNVGAIGPTQVRPDYWGKFCGFSDLSDPEQNVYCGAQVLSYHLERCDGDTYCALSAYNVGPYAKGQSAARRYVKKIGRHLSSLENSTL